MASIFTIDRSGTTPVDKDVAWVRLRFLVGDSGTVACPASGPWGDFVGDATGDGVCEL